MRLIDFLTANQEIMLMTGGMNNDESLYHIFFKKAGGLAWPEGGGA